MVTLTCSIKVTYLVNSWVVRNTGLSGPKAHILPDASIQRLVILLVL